MSTATNVPKNVLIQHSLFLRIVDLLEYWNIPESHDLRFEYCSVLSELYVKLRRLEIRDAYSKIIFAKDEDTRIDARIDYLRKRSSIGDILPE